MKKSYLLLFTILIALFNSCVVYEDVYFANDGKIKYEMLVDASRMLSSVPDIGSKLSEGKAYKDTTMTYSDFCSDLDSLPQDKKEILKKLALRFELKNNPNESQFTALFSGEFDDARSMTEAFATLDSIERNQSDSTTESFLTPNIGKIKMYSFYTWNGNSMSRTSANTEVKEDVEEDIEDSAMMNMLMGGSGEYTVRYHFPNKVKSVNNKDATFSLDGKTVILKLPLSSLKNNSDALNIEVEMEK